MSILSVSNKLFPNGDPLPGGSTIPGISPYPGLPISQSALAKFSLVDPADKTKYLDYAFLFWNISGAANPGIYSTANVNIQVGNNDINATAWYVKTGGNGPWTGVNTYAFSEPQDMFLLTDVPIDHVDPPAAWTPAGGQYVKTVTANKTGVDIYALNTNKGEDFDLWLTFGGGTVTGSKLHANENAAIWAAIAYYKEPAPIQWPDTGKYRTKPGKIIYGDWANEVRIAERFAGLVGSKAKSKVAVGPKDAASPLIDQIEKMSVQQLRSALAIIKTHYATLTAVQKFINQKLQGK